MSERSLHSRPALVRRIVAGLTLAVVAVGGPAAAQRQRGGRDDLPPPRLERHVHDWTCAAGRAEALRAGIALLEPVGDGQPAFFDQVPRILFPTFQGEVRFDRFVVVGDHPTVQFRLWDTEAPDGQREERWSRVRTEVVGGKTVSVFNPSWPNEEFERIFSLQRWGWDRPMLFWGTFVVPGTGTGADDDGPDTRNVWLRMRSLNLPRSQVRQAGPGVQYTSHVANLVLPGFGDTRLARDDLDFDEARVSSEFYRSFRDVYEGLAVLPQANHLGDFGAFHFNTRNDVSGIGRAVFDGSAFYGSDGALQGIEVYPNMRFAANDTSSHEIAHQWASNFDWSSIAGVRRAGHQPDSHAPLWSGGETLLGAVLEGTVRAMPGSGPGAWVIRRSPAPLRFHPVTLYSMGLLSPAQVAPFEVFADQGQFDAETSTAPDPGTPVTGGTRPVAIQDVIDFHGPRIGPVPRVWERATVVVSRDAPLTPVELDYYTFFAERLADPGRTGVVSYEGYPSFDASTFRRVDLQTRIKPRLEGLPTLLQTRRVGFPQFARRDTRVLFLDAPVSTRWRVGQRRTLSGRVVATDRSDFDRVLIRFWRYDGTVDDAVRFESAVGPDGRFSLPVEFAPGGAGRYALEVFLFWPGAAPQFPRARLSPVVVEPPPAS